MEIYQDIPRRFLPMFERREPIIGDHTATQEYRRCPREYFYSTVLSYKEKTVPVHLNFGTAYHKFKEDTELAYMQLGSDEQKNKSSLVSCMKKGIESSLSLWDKVQKRDPIPGDKWDFMSRARLLDVCLYSGKAWMAEKEAGRVEVLATEQPINVVLDRADGKLIHIGGRADQVVRVAGQLWGRDFKTTSKNLDWYDKKNDPNEQFTRYTFMEGELNGERIQGQLIEVMFNAKGGKTERSKAATGPELKTFSTSYTNFQLDKWREELEYWDHMLEYSRENDSYPMSYATCEWCRYRELCKSPNERTLEMKLKTMFTFRVWNHQDPSN